MTGKSFAWCGAGIGLAAFGIASLGIVGCVTHTRTVYVYPDGTTSAAAPSGQVELVSADLVASADGASLSGTWFCAHGWSGIARLDAPPVTLRLVRADVQPTTEKRVQIRSSSLLPLMAPEASTRPAECRIERAGSVIILTLTDAARHAGALRVEPNTTYIAELETLTGEKIARERLLELAFSGPAIQYVRDLKAAGYTFGIAELCRLSEHGVSARYASELMTAGYKFTADGLIRLSQHGVSSSDASALRSAGYTFGADELVKLSQYGVSSTTAAAHYQAGYRFNCDQLIKLSQYGISSSYAAGLRQAGYEYTPEQLIKLSQYGVSATLAESLVDPKLKNLTAEDLVALPQRGVDADTAKRLRGSR